MLYTEQFNPAHADLDLYPTTQLVDSFIDDQLQAVRAAQAAAPVLARAVDAAVERLNAGGRLLYVGAGTSGRLGLLDCAELPPTFSWPQERAVAVLAGGASALFEAVEGAEDDAQAADAALLQLGITPQDVVLLIAASGRTPFVLGALQRATQAGALTVAIVNNPGSPIAAGAAHAIVLDTGPEVISGSTRMKAGTAQKIALNTLSSALMVRLHKVYGNLMVDMRATNAKLYGRAVRLTVAATGLDEVAAQATLACCDYQVKVAIVALRCGISVDAARVRLQSVAGDVRRAMAMSRS